jgi:hypothetical protein
MRYLFAPVLVACTFGWSALAAEPVPATEGKPAPKAVAPANDVPALIKQLGDDDAKVREAASERLRRLGQIAMPALAEAQKSEDPEVASRAKAIARRIEEDRRAPAREELAAPDVPSKLRFGRARGGAGADLGPGRAVREVNTVEGTKRIKIREDANGIVITTTERTADGAEVTQTTKARDAAQLKREFPEAYGLYEKHIAGARAAGGLEELGLEPLEQLRAQLKENAEIDSVLRDARRMLEEQRPMIEAQQRTAEEQLREARRMFDEQMRHLHEDPRGRGQGQQE